MPKAYWISAYRSIIGPAALAEYGKLAGPALQEAGGRFIARGVPAMVYEAGVKEWTVLIEFDSAQQAIAAHDSAGYQKALAALGDGAVGDVPVRPDDRAPWARSIPRSVKMSGPSFRSG